MDNIVGDLGEKVGTALISRERTIIEKTPYAIHKLKEPTKGGSTHVIVGHFGECLALLSKDEEGVWLEDLVITTGKIDSFYRD